jgi:hypothetical protein
MNESDEEQHLQNKTWLKKKQAMYGCHLLFGSASGLCLP